MEQDAGEIEYEDPGTAPDAPPAGGSPSRRGSRLRWVVAFGALVTLVAGAIAVLVHQPETDADAALDAAQEALDRAGSYRFEVRTTTHTSIGDPDGAGSESTERSLTTGAMSGRDWQVVAELGPEMGDGRFESRRVGSTAYFFSSGGPEDDLPGPDWGALPIEDEPSREERIRDAAEEYREMEESAEEDEDDGYEGFEVLDSSWRLQQLLGTYLLSIDDDPHAIERLVREARDPEVEEHLADGGLRLRAQLDPIPEIAEVARHPIPPVALTLDLDRDDRPSAARFDAAAKGASAAVEVRFSDWDAPLAVAAPPDDQIDHTPWISEEAISALDPSLVLAPTSVPPGFELTAANAYDQWIGGDDEEHEDCTSLDLSYAVKADQDRIEAIDEDDDDARTEAFDAARMLDLTFAPARCDESVEDYGETFAGLPSDGIEEGYVNVVLGDVLVTISTDHVDDAAIEAVVRSLRPTTGEALAAAIPDWAKEDSGGWGPGPAWSGISVGGTGGSFVRL